MLSNLIGFILIGSSIVVGTVFFMKASALEKEIAAELSSKEDADTDANDSDAGHDEDDE